MTPGEADPPATSRLGTASPASRWAARFAAVFVLGVSAFLIYWLQRRDVRLGLVNGFTIFVPGAAACFVLALPRGPVIRVANTCTILGALIALTSYVGLLYLPAIVTYFVAARGPYRSLRSELSDE